MSRRGSAQKLLGNFTEALETLGASPKLVRTLTRAREEIVPKAEELIREIDRVLERAAELKHGLRDVQGKIVREEEIH